MVPSIPPECPVAADLPYGAVDTHVHLFDPHRFAYAAVRSYTPPMASIEELQAMQLGLGIERALLVQPSVYGTDNRCLLQALKRGGLERLRGIAVVDLDDAAQSGREQLARLGAQGVRGIRLNLEVRHEADPQRMRRELLQAASRVDLAGWCVQLHLSATLLPVLESCLDAFQVPLVLDHFGGLHAADADPGSPGLQSVLRLLASGRVYLKLSAFYKASKQAPDHPDLQALVRRLIAARPDRLLWGSDWPHTGGGSGPRDPARVEPFRQVDLAASLQALRRWCANDAVLRQILVSNPETLYGFTPHASTSTETP